MGSPKQINRAIKRVLQDDVFWAIMQDDVCSGPFDGGCLLVALALKKAFGGKLVTLVRDSGVADHYGCLIDGTIYDFDGAAKTGTRWSSRFRSNECVRYSLKYVDSHVPNPDVPTGENRSIELVAGMLKKVLDTA